MRALISVSDKTGIVEFSERLKGLGIDIISTGGTYYKLESLRDKLESIKTSLRATEAILKGAAIQYDLDPSNAEKLLSAYTQNINLKKNYYFAICSYNIEFAELIYRMGLSLEDFHTTYMLK